MYVYYFEEYLYIFTSQQYFCTCVLASPDLHGPLTPKKNFSGVKEYARCDYTNVTCLYLAKKTQDPSTRIPKLQKLQKLQKTNYTTYT